MKYTSKSIQQIIVAPQKSEGDGFIVRQPLPFGEVLQVDPFLLIHEIGPKILAPGEPKGASSHPHRGFETVSYIIDGELEHKDSAGNSGKLFAGDVQWMTAGRGIVHSEHPSARFQREGGPIHALQIWVNLPKSKKMGMPRYQDTPSNQLPFISSKGLSVKVIAGEFAGQKSPIQPTVPVEYFDVQLENGQTFVHAVSQNWSSLIYVLSGAIATTEGSKIVEPGQMAVFADGGDQIEVSASGKNSRFIFLSGEKLNEPMARHGPIVMNTDAELATAFKELQTGQFLKNDGR